MVAAVMGSAGSSLPDSPLLLQSRVLGNGSSVVLLGGGLLGADGWGDVPRVLAKTRRVVNLQSLAVQYGLENRSLPKGYSIHTEVDALRRTLDSMRVLNADIIGMSHGGVIALVFALANPERVRTLTLIEPPAFWMLPNHGYDDTGAREMQELVSSLRGREVGEEHVERFRCRSAIAPADVRLVSFPDGRSGCSIEIRSAASTLSATTTTTRRGCAPLRCQH
jgi:pimeloyl-ACP methyl ester carboxylesterase